MRLLIVEDDTALRRGLAVALRSNGLRVHDTADAAGALRAVGAMDYDLILLDLGLPDVDGITLLPQLRLHHRGPVIVLSARRDQSDKVAALDAGADDYMTKPFGLPELLARIRAQARRAGIGAVVHAGPLTIDLGHEVVTDATGGHIDLTATEWKLLAALARAGGAPLTPEVLLEEVWGLSGPRRRNYVRVYINLLRRKLEPDPGHPVLIRSGPGRGYWLELAPAGDPGMGGAAE
jgi:two-component system, OmpR family, KDP operon response regulator KdpE